jgi:hypothetical protein
MTPKSKRILKRLNDPTHRTKMLDKLNQDNLPEAAPITNNGQEMTVLKDMNDLANDHEAYMESLRP